MRFGTWNEMSLHSSGLLMAVTRELGKYELDILDICTGAEFVGDRISHIVLRSRWCNIIVLNVHTPSEEKSDDSKDSFDKELDQVSHHIP
jgi:hypothetical protein